MSGSSGEGSEESASKADASQDRPMEGVNKEPLCDKREREAPDAAAKPEGKAQKTSSAAASTPTTTVKGRGTNALDPEPDDSSDDEECSDEVELGKAWRRCKEDVSIVAAMEA